MRKSPKPFLTAQWQYLAMLNYEVDPVVLKKHIPAGTELDLWEGKAIVSMVGFMFNNTHVWGVKWPGHINFEEVNLRYYIKRKTEEGYKRGVGFISEIVPKPLIAFFANALYNEHYSAMPMSHTIDVEGSLINVEYNWTYKRKQNTLRVKALDKPLLIAAGSEEEFIFEHYWGYNALNDHTTVEYGVQHPRWETYPVIDYYLNADVESLYGKEFVPFIPEAKPASVFLAKGSSVAVLNLTKFTANT